jgi:hypothetical protein
MMNARSCAPEDTSNVDLCYQLVESEEFRNFITYLRRGYAIPDRKTLSSELIPSLLLQVESAVKLKLANIHHFAITIDTWTSLANRQYLSLTLHGIDNEMELQSFLLVTIDTGGTMISAVKDELELCWLNCMAHAINLSVERGLVCIEALTNKAGRISIFFHKSLKASKILQEQQRVLGIPFLKLKLSVSTRWNSV